ncbi:MAG: phosphatidylglycerophosphatase A, partial [Bacillota bacterium]|nr:phosphatidylglycerophosphatase A [Bacillota bacterium]
VLELQRSYYPGLTLEACRESVGRVLEKREVQHAILTGIALDMLAEEGVLPEPLLDIVRRDDPLYGVDEILALSIVNVYGSVGLTNFGYLDKAKLGIVKRLNRHRLGRVNTFLDDLISAVAAAAAARLAHQNCSADNHREDLGKGEVR